MTSSRIVASGPNPKQGSTAIFVDVIEDRSSQASARAKPRSWLRLSSQLWGCCHRGSYFQGERQGQGQGRSSEYRASQMALAIEDRLARASASRKAKSSLRASIKTVGFSNRGSQFQGERQGKAKVVAQSIGQAVGLQPSRIAPPRPALRAGPRSWL